MSMLRSSFYVKRSIFFDFSWEGGGTLPKNNYKPSRIPGPMRIYPVKENPIGSAVS
jgi:hypothetical protein